MPNNRNLKFKNVEAYWNSFKKDQSKKSLKLSGEPWVANMVESHIQGFGKIYDSKNRRHISIASHNNKGYSKGFMMYMECGRDKKTIKQDVPVEHYNHPGGFQTVGDYMFIAVETSDYKSSFVRLCDLSNLCDGKEPDWVSSDDFLIAMPDHGAGMVGATTYTDADGKEKALIVVCDNGNTYIYQTDAGNDLPVARGVTPKLVNRQNINGSVQGIGLITQTDNTVYLVALCSSPSGASFKDEIELWKCTFNNGVPTFNRVGDTKHVKTSGGGATGVHLRYGAGIGLIRDDLLEFFATQRNFVGGKMKYDILYYEK